MTPFRFDTSGVIYSNKIIIDVSAGFCGGLAITNDGLVVGWGTLPNVIGSGTARNSIISMTPYNGVIGSWRLPSKVAVGGSHSIVMTTDGSLFSSGANTNGQLGSGGNATIRF